MYLLIKSQKHTNLKKNDTADTTVSWELNHQVLILSNATLAWYYPNVRTCLSQTFLSRLRVPRPGRNLENL